jgi:lipoprotein NlpI
MSYTTLFTTFLITIAGSQPGPTGVGELLAKARAALSQGQPQEALALANKAIERDPANVRAYVLRGTIHDKLRKFDLAVADYTQVLKLDPKAAEAYDRRGTSHFMLGEIGKSVADFDRFVELRPAEKPGHWRRGIALYYAGRYEDGQKQFQSYEQVDTNDVENAVWCYLCAARRLGPEKARAALLKIGKDRRVPLMTVYDLFRGQAKPADVLAATNAGQPTREELDGRLFYAHLYLALYYEAQGDRQKTLEHLSRAVNLRIGHYMWEVARVHRDLLKPQRTP